MDRGWEMAVRIEKNTAVVLHEAHGRQVEEAMETIDDPSNPPPPIEPDFDRVMVVGQKYGIEMLPLA